jgi:DNA gyrase inhibitor GyrI
MTELNVRVERLKPMRVASFRAFSETPELDCWNTLLAWAEPRRLLKEPKKHPVFGFNNPNPSQGHKDYGYELWIEVDTDFTPEGEVEIKEVPGGDYAVVSQKGLPSPDGWRTLWQWVQGSLYKWRKAQELEKVSNPFAKEEDIVSELYLPIDSVKT